MPLEWTIDHALRMVTVIAEGEITLGQSEEYLYAVVVADAMPYAKLVDCTNMVTQASAEGPVTLKDIENYLDAIVMSDAQPYAKLFDAGTMVLQLSDDELMLLGARMSAYGSAFAAGPLAFVATTPAVEGFAKRFLNV